MTKTKQWTIAKIMCQWVVNDLRPFCLFDSKDGRALMQALRPGLAAPSAYKIRKWIMGHLFIPSFEQFCGVLKEQLAGLSRSLSLRFDGWTSPRRTPIIGYTVSYIDSQWQLRTAHLAFREMALSHTASNLVQDTVAMLQDYGLTLADVVSATTDSASNCMAAVDEMGIVHTSCLPYLLNRVAQVVLGRTAGSPAEVKQTVKPLLVKAKGLVTYFHQSIRAATRLQELCAEGGCPYKALVQEVETRW
jgi:hypothetical protein